MQDHGAQTFLFADLAGFAALTEAHGDETAAELAAGFFEAARRLLPEYGGEEINTIGDAILLRCGEAGAAVAYGLRLVAEIGARPQSPILRVGMHTGPAVEREGDWFGAAINLAARVSALAGGNEVLLTQTTRDAAGELENVEFRHHGRRRFRHMSDRVEIFRATRVDEDVRDLPIDPVCRMAVDPGQSVGTLSYEGVDYHFCSINCVRAFTLAPDDYVGLG